MSKGAIASGTGAWIGLAPQASWGAATQTANELYLPVVSFDGGLEQELQSRNDLTTSASERGYWKTGQKVKFSSTHLMDFGDLVSTAKCGHEMWLKRAFGASASAQILTSTAYSHTFTLANAKILASLEMTLDNAIGCLTRPANMITAVEFSVDGPFDPVKVKYEYLGRAEDAFDATSTSPTGKMPPDNLIVPCLGETGGVLSVASTPYSITKWRVRIEDPMDDGTHYIGLTRTMGLPARSAKRVITGELTTYFDATEAAAMYALYAGQTAAKIEINYQSTEIVGATGSNYQFYLMLPNVVPTGKTPEVGGPGMVEFTFPFRAFYDTTNSVDAVSLVLINTNSYTSGSAIL